MQQILLTPKKVGPKGKPIRLSKLEVDAERRLILAVKARMMARGEAFTADTLRDKGYSEPFIKRFLAA